MILGGYGAAKIMWDSIELQALSRQPLALYCLDICTLYIHASSCK